MFTEILRIKPILDRAAAAAMDENLHKRFSRVAKRFSGGLKSAIKGSILGISVGLLSRLLNPIEAIEEKIKKLLGESTELKDLADRFNTSGGQLRRIQDAGAALGLEPDKLKDIMEKFASAVEQARDELKDPLKERSDSTRVLQNFVGEKDLAEGFFKFIQSLKATGGTAREQAEKIVFGERQHGAAKRFIDADFPKVFGDLKEPSAQKINQSINKTASLADQQRLLSTRNQTSDFIKTSDLVNGNMIRSMEASAKKEQDRLNKQIASYADLKRGADAADNIKEALVNVTNLISQLLGKITFITEWLPKITDKAWWSGLFSRGGR